MIAAFESLLPIFLLIGLGFLLRWRKVVATDMWQGVELLGYWVFFPALLSETLIRAELRAHFHTFPKFTGRTTHFPMMRQRLHPSAQRLAHG